MHDPVAALVAAGRTLAARGWTPATSGNLSVRAETGFWVTASGPDKGNLTPEDILRVDAEGRPIGVDRRPSAETWLHAALYERFPAIGSVLHVHSRSGTLLSRRVSGDTLVLSGFELLKAFAGTVTHDVSLRVPVVDNSQDVPSIARAVAPLLDGPDLAPGYLIRGHGLYTWGATLPDALRHAEAFDFLFSCVLEELPR